MIITERFVFVHMPKTGGTFVTSCLKRLHGRPTRRLLPAGPWARDGHQYTELRKHATCSEIPPRHRHKPIVSIIRNPYDRYVSRYHYGVWKRADFPGIDWERLRADHPDFPDLTFEQFVDVWTSLRYHKLDLETRHAEQLGSQSWDLVRFYFRDPAGVFPTITDAYIDDKRYFDDMFDVAFLHTDKLNRDLYECLVGFGYDPDAVGFVRDLGTILPGGGTPRDAPWRSYYTEELKGLVRHRERLVFALFPEFDS